MKRRAWVLVGVAVAVLAVAAIVALPLFLPQGSVKVDDLTEGSATVLKQGTFTGRGGHTVTGTVQVVRIGEAHFLRFLGYEQTPGPDVFVYVTTAPGDPEAYGTKVLLDGVEEGHSRKVGSFDQALPAGVDVAKVTGVTIWCDRFDALFGDAALSPP